MQFSVGHICIVAVLIASPFLQGVEAADAKAGAKSAGKLAGGGKAADGTPDIVAVIQGFLKEEIPPTATGTVSNFLADYLKKCTQGGAAAAAGSTPSKRTAAAGRSSPKALLARGSTPSKRPAAAGKSSPKTVLARGSSAAKAPSP